jgi:subtilisin family serine protease
MSRASSTHRGARLLAIAAVALTPLAVLAAPASAAPGGLPAATADSVPGAWIVTLQSGASPDGVATEHSRRYQAQVDHLFKYAVHGYSARMSDRAAAEVARDPRVASVERDQVVSIEAQTTPTGIDRIEADVNSVASGNGSGAVDVDVAVIDTGIDLKHPDLDVVGGKNCSTGSSYADGNGHGSHVAGIIGAKDNGVGVVGVAPGARLWAVRVLNNQGSGTRSSIMCGIDWVTQNKSTIDVANMSLGGSGTDSTCGGSDTYHNAICRSVAAGVTYVVAAGNDGADARNFVPAAYDEVITVSALADFNGLPGGGAPSTCRADQDDTLADFSNYGADVDLIAPGVCIYSTWKGGSYNTISGTSMASPHVTGAAALYKSTHPAATPAEVRTALRDAGTQDWNTATDRDAFHEPLLSVAGL